ncbi:MAG: helix-turn-helix domain-containing protein [Desulfatibacillaceae bacterium]
MMKGAGWFKDMLDRVEGTPEFRLAALEHEVTEQLWIAMEARGMSKADLAEKLGVSRASVTMLFRDGSNLTLKRMLHIADALDCEVDIRIRPREQAGGLPGESDAGRAMG